MLNLPYLIFGNVVSQTHGSTHYPCHSFKRCSSCVNAGDDTMCVAMRIVCSYFYENWEYVTLVFVISNMRTANYI